MDDGFQNFSVAKDLSLLVIDAGGFGNGRLIPAGPLRERPKHGFARADAAVLVGNGEHDLPPFAGQTLRARVELVGCLKLEGRKVFAFCGIGKPEKFFRMLTEMGARLVGSRSFPDHHNFSRDDMEWLKTRADALGAHLVTTEKDFVRLDEDAREGVLPVPIRIVFDDGLACSALLQRLAT
jgi:tetraacyldisaccharide 4'-kinase